MSFDVAPEEAIEYFKNKKIVTRKKFDKLAEDARAGAFTVAQVYRTDVIQGFKDEIVSALENGTAQREVIKHFRSILDGAGHKQLGAFHLETVFRTNMMMAYGVGRRRALEDVAGDLSYWQYHAVMDDRVRPTHAALNNLILPADHEFWNNHFPPWGFNCRCSVTATDEIPDGYDHSNPNGENDTKIFYDERGNPAKAEIGTSVFDLLAEGTLPGIPPQSGLKNVIQQGAIRAKESKQKPASQAAKTLPMGTPVSTALKAQGPKDFQAQMNKSFELIDKVHGDGVLPDLPVIRNVKKSSNGFFQHTLNGKPIKISISRYGDAPQFTALHEVGHFLDYSGITKGKYASGNSPEFAEWREAVMQSKAIKRLTELSGKHKANAVVEGKEIEYIVQGKFVRYLLKTNEIWARSYSQYIAKMSGDAGILKQLDSRRSAVGYKLYPMQWEDEDFEPIASAIEKLFRSLGWLK